MFIVTRDEMKKMAQPRLRELITSEINESYTNLLQGMPADLVVAMVDGGISRARAFGLTDINSVAAFVFLMFEIGPEFYRHPEISNVLKDPSIPAAEKIKELMNQTSNTAWKETAADVAQQSWFPEDRSGPQDGNAIGEAS